MAIAITTGYNLSANDSTPGVKNLWILSEEPETITPATGGPITAYTTVGDDGTWLKFECAQGEGDWSVATTAGSGGKEHVTTVNYRIGGLDQTKLSLLETVLDSQRITIVAEHADGKYFHLSRNGFSANAGTVTSGTTGGGAASIGATVAFTASDSIKATQVTVATTLAAITDA